MAQLLNTDAFTAARKSRGDGFLTEQDALSLYSSATHLDNIPGVYPPDDGGSSGLAVAKAAKKAGYIRSYRHAFGLQHFLAALQLQPVIVGTPWTKGMFTPDANGVVRPTGDVAGGHEYLALGVDYTREQVTFLNSWSDTWGQDGRFHMSFEDFDLLLSSKGDVVAPQL